MRDFWETTALVGVVIVLAAMVLVCIMSASILAVDRASVIDAVGAFGADDNISADSWCSGAPLQSSTCR